MPIIDVTLVGGSTDNNANSSWKRSLKLQWNLLKYQKMSCAVLSAMCQKLITLSQAFQNTRLKHSHFLICINNLRSLRYQRRLLHITAYFFCQIIDIRL